MRSLAIAAACGVLLAGCGGASRPPEWRTDAADAFDGFQRHYLAGNTRLAEREFAVAQSALASTGRLELAARAELIRCALATAALDFERCAAFDAVHADAGAEDRAYAAFLRGEWSRFGAPGDADARLLPAGYRNVLAARDAQAQNRAMQAMEDPLSRLVAAGVLFKLARVSPAGVGAAVDAASAQGWRRPLLAWLAVQAKAAEAAGDSVALAIVRRRIELAGGKNDDAR